MKKTIVALFAAGTCLLLGQLAHADTIGLQGVSKASGDSSKTSPTKITFTNPWHVVASDGIFAGTNGVAVTMSSFSFSGDGNGAVCITCPQTQWKFTFNGTTYKFTLQSLINASTSAGSFAANGVGVVTIGTTNYSANWSLNGSGSNFKYRVSFVTNSVPDGGTAVALLGIALAGIEGTRRLLHYRRA